MLVETFPIGPLETNCHLAWEGSLAVVVDPGGDPAPILDVLKRNGLVLDRVLLTHLHFDHVYGAKKLTEATGATAVASADDAFLLRSELGKGGFMGFPAVAEYAFDEIQPGETTFAGMRCRVLATPGHTPGSLSYHFPDAKVCFVGDLVFYRGVGRTDFPGGSFETLKASIAERIFTLPDDTVLYPGHGDPTTVRDEKLHNPYLRTW